MNIWPMETATLVKAGTSLVPLATGLLIAEGLAMRTRMFSAARFWAWLAGVSLAVVTLCFLAGLVCWMCFDCGPGTKF